MLSLFGFPTVVVNHAEIHFKRRKSLALLAYLAISEGPKSREYLANLLWPSLPTRSAGQNLRNILADIRATPVGQWIHGEEDQIGLDPSAPKDIDQFNGTVRRLEDRLVGWSELPASLVTPMEEAIALYGRGFLAGFRIGDSPEFDDWQYLHAQRFQEMAISILATLGRHYVDRHLNEPARRVLADWQALDSLSEEAHRLLMQLHSQNGEPDQALHVYQSFARNLQRQEGAEPDAETRALYDRILGGKAVRRPASPAPVRRPVNSILPAEPPLLFGRSADLRTLKEWLGVAGEEEPRSPIVLYGEPGVGKSALAAALAYDPDTQAAFPDGVLWATLGPWPDHDATLRLWTSVLEVQELKDVRAVDHRAMHLAAALYDRRVLMVIDDVWSLYDARLLTLARRNSAALITTRFPALAQQIARQPGDVYALDPLDEAASLSLLAKRAPALVDQFPDEVYRLMHCYRGVPLILNLLAQTFNQRRLVEPGGMLPPMLMDPVRLLDQPLASEQMVSRELPSLRTMVDALWQRLPEPTRAAATQALMRSRRPYLLDLTRINQAAGSLADALADSGLVYRKRNRLRLNPFLVALVLSAPRSAPVAEARLYGSSSRYST